MVGEAPSPTSEAASKCLEHLRLYIITYLLTLTCKFLEVKGAFSTTEEHKLAWPTWSLEFGHVRKLEICLKWLIFVVSLLSPEAFRIVHDRNGP